MGSGRNVGGLRRRARAYVEGLEKSVKRRSKWGRKEGPLPSRREAQAGWGRQGQGTRGQGRRLGWVGRCWLRVLLNSTSGPSTESPRKGAPS